MPVFNTWKNDCLMECLKFALVLLCEIHDTWVSNHTIRTVQLKYHEDKWFTICRLQSRSMELKKGIGN